MDQTKLDLWLTALRSGEYSQAEGYLCTKGGYCCLGVASDLAVKAGVGEWRYDSDYEAASYFCNGEASASSAIPSLVKWLGITPLNDRILAAHDALNEIDFKLSKDGPYGKRTAQLYLTELNDEGLSFSQIADVIEWAYRDYSASEDAVKTAEN